MKPSGVVATPPTPTQIQRPGLTRWDQRAGLAQPGQRNSVVVDSVLRKTACFKTNWNESMPARHSSRLVSVCSVRYCSSMGTKNKNWNIYQKSSAGKFAGARVTVNPAPGLISPACKPGLLLTAMSMLSTVPRSGLLTLTSRTGSFAWSEQTPMPPNMKVSALSCSI